MADKPSAKSLWFSVLISVLSLGMLVEYTRQVLTIEHSPRKITALVAWLVLAVGSILASLVLGCLRRSHGQQRVDRPKAALTTTEIAGLQDRVDALFATEYREEALRLVHEWGNAMPPDLVGALGGDPNRLLFAALRVSHGDLARLRKAIAVGRFDFRDLLSAAGFGATKKHEQWVPEPGDASARERSREERWGIPYEKAGPRPI